MDLKKCTGCREEKPYSDFGIKGGKPSTRISFQFPSRMAFPFQNSSNTNYPMLLIKLLS